MTDMDSDMAVSINWGSSLGVLITRALYLESTPGPRLWKLPEVLRISVNVCIRVHAKFQIASEITAQR